MLEISATVGKRRIKCVKRYENAKLFRIFNHTNSRDRKIAFRRVIDDFFPCLICTMCTPSPPQVCPYLVSQNHDQLCAEDGHLLFVVEVELLRQHGHDARNLLLLVHEFLGGVGLKVVGDGVVNSCHHPHQLLLLQTQTHM